jgi:hypothetical protein
MTTSVVRIGPLETSGVSSAKLLRTALFSYLQQGDDKLLKLSNKYFIADILLEDIEAPSKPENSKEDGVILVFDALASNPDQPGGGGVTFDSLGQTHQQAEERDTCGDLLRLCVGVSLTSLSPEEGRGKKHENEYSRRILWCLDRGYEYVEADLSEEGQSKGHDQRDKDGFARIVEAIQGTVWSSAIMSKSKSTELKDTYKEDTSVVELKKEDEEENPYQPPDPSKFGVNAFSEESKAEIGLSVEPGKVTSEGIEGMEKLRQDVDEEKVFDEMETVLREASRVRDQSKNGQLTDDERRDRAGDAALRLVNLMHQFGVEDDENDSIVDSDEDSGIVDTS